MEIAARRPMGKYFKDISGQRFGMLTVVSLSGFKGPYSVWNCRCDCGKDAIAQGHLLRRGSKKSCGCNQHAATTKHGMHKSPEYKAWKQMIQRCTNPREKRYARYGGRGIRVCERWRIFENFFSDLGPRPSSRHSIDRKNNDGDYEPCNCRWASRVQQMRNFSRNRLIRFRGVTRCLQEWADDLQITPSTLSVRISQRGVEAALTCSKSNRGRKRKEQLNAI